MHYNTDIQTMTKAAIKSNTVYDISLQILSYNTRNVLSWTCYNTAGIHDIMMINDYIYF